jgi:hypothetical protein
MKAAYKSVDNTLADCGHIGDFAFVGKLSEFHPQAIQPLSQIVNFISSI